MIKREIEPFLIEAAGQFKALALTGPRQSGKTTTVRMAFPDKPYVTLESPDERERALRDPRQFLSRLPDGGIIDEIQRAPQLFAYLQEILDARRDPGQFILTGSQQFGMMETISQSLAGRVAIFSLLPFSAQELKKGGWLASSVDETLFRGGYPPVFDQQIQAPWWFDSYITTYVERDVRQITNVGDLILFQRFLTLCAGNVGQLVNANRIGSDCGVNHGTVSSWLSVLEASFVAFRLAPHHRNFRKRIVKTPKLYFWDTGLVIRLLGIQSAGQLATHPLRGSLFENWVIVEFMKRRFHSGRKSNLFFWRNNTGLEVDIIAEQADRLMPVEIKSGGTIATDWVKGIDEWLALSGDAAVDPALVYGGDTLWREGQVSIFPWNQMDALLERI